MHIKCSAKHNNGYKDMQITYSSAIHDGKFNGTEEKFRLLQSTIIPRQLHDMGHSWDVAILIIQ